MPQSEPADIERFKEALQKIVHLKANGFTSTIGPLHGAGIHDGIRFCQKIAEEALRPYDVRVESTTTPLPKL